GACSEPRRGVSIAREVEENGQVRGPGRIGARRPARFALPAALALEAVLALLDQVVASSVPLTTTFVLAPAALAITGRVRDVAIARAAPLVPALARRFWDPFPATARPL